MWASGDKRLDQSRFRAVSAALQSPSSIHHVIGGQSVIATSGRASDVFNPASGQVVARVHLASTQDVHAAVTAAKDAFPAWAETATLRRARVLSKFKELLDRH